MSRKNLTHHSSLITHHFFYMFCQECGVEIRQTARFCNKCGMEVKQRFSQSQAAPKPQTPPPSYQSEPPRDERAVSGEQPWPRAEQALIMPAVSKPRPAEPPAAKSEPSPRPPRDPNGDRPTLFEPPAPKPAVSASAPVSRDETPRSEETPRAPQPLPVSANLQREFTRKPFFTQVAPAAPNRQHSRLMLVLLILLPIVIAVALLAYRAAK